MVNPSSGVVPDRKVAKVRRASGRRGEAPGRAAGGGVDDASGPPAAAAADRSFRPPVSRSSSIGRQGGGGGDGEDQSGHGGTSSMCRRSGTPERTGVRGNRGRGEVVSAGDSDCDTVGAEEDMIMAAAGGDDGGGGAGAGAAAPRTPRAYEDSDGGSRFYGSSGDERNLAPGAGGGSRGLPAPSPLTMVHHRHG